MIEKEPEKSGITRRNLLKKMAAAAVVLPFVKVFPVNAEDSNAVEELETLTLGNTDVRVVVYQKGTSNYTLFNMHDNENTAVDAARKFIDEQGGRLVELQHTGDRFISFSINDKQYLIDPNRMFSEVGIRKNLADLNDNYSEDAVAAVHAFAQNLLNRFILSQGGGIVAVHNNTNRDLQITSFSSEAVKIHVQQNTDPDDFFIVTDERDFKRLRAKGFNVALQSKEKVSDDGSLLVFCGKKGIRYINVEAQHGHEKKQLRMLEAI